MNKLMATAFMTGVFLFLTAGCAASAAAAAVQSGSVSGVESTATAVQTTAPQASGTAQGGAIVLSGSEPHSITSGGSYTVSGTLTDAQLIVNTTDAVALELAGVSIKNSAGAAIAIENAKEVTISLKAGTVNTLEDGGDTEYNAVIFSNDTLIIEGGGELNLTAKQAHGIESDDDIIINGGNININAVKDGIHAKDELTVNGGVINIPSAYEGLESKGTLTINGGEITALCTDDGVNAGTLLTITGGKVYVKSTMGDGIDCNGEIYQSGGTVVTEGAGGAEGGIDCDRNNLTITGGTLVAVGGTGGSVPTQSTSTQYSAVLAGAAANTLLTIQGESGEAISFKAADAYQCIVLSSPLLQKDKTYTVYTSGTVTGGESVGGLVSGGAYSGGTEREAFTASAVVTTQGITVGMGGGKGGGMRGTPPPAAAVGN